MDKKRREFVQAAVVVGTGAILLNGLGCGDDTGTDAGGTDSGVGTDSGGMDAGGTDSGGTDTGGTDAGGTDTGGTDAGGTDTGGTDAGGADADGTDAGGTDAGGTDAGAACEAVVVEIVTDHRHSLTVPAADVAAGVDQSYTIDGGHSHPVMVTAAHFASLAAGETVTLDSGMGRGHMHRVTLVCGAP